MILRGWLPAPDLGYRAQLHVFKNDVAKMSVRPAVMHDSVTGDPMWLVAEHGDGADLLIRARP